jgi:hypothetical protein
MDSRFMKHLRFYVALSHMTLCLAPVLEGFPGYSYMTVGFFHSLVFYSLV